MPTLEKRIVEKIEKYYWIIGIILLSIFAGFIRSKMISFESSDYTLYLGPWLEQLKDGGLAAIASYEGNYNMPYVIFLALITYIHVPYLVSIKLLSIVFDFILALSCATLVANLVSKNKKEFFVFTYGAILFLPPVLLNGALWGQCDSIYASFAILALLFLLKEKYTRSFIMLGVAFAIKLQTIFILPIFIVLYFSKKKFSISKLLIIPIVNIIMSLPAIINGVSIGTLFGVYGEQIKTYDFMMVMNFPNMYNLLNAKPEIFYTVSTVLALVICMLVLGYILAKKIEWTNEKILTLTLWVIVVITYVLPGMHDRYMYLGEILVILLLITYKKHLPLAIFAIGSTFVTYSAFLFGNSYDLMPLLSAIYFVIIGYFTKDVFNLLNEKVEKGRKQIHE